MAAAGVIAFNEVAQPRAMLNVVCERAAGRGASRAQLSSSSSARCGATDGYSNGRYGDSGNSDRDSDTDSNARASNKRPESGSTTRTGAEP